MCLSKKEKILVEKGKRLIDKHPVVFFDVFDTLIARDCAQPHDVFDLVETAYNREHRFVQNFRVKRAEAERQCVKKGMTPTLNQIYECLQFEDKEALKKLEIKTEIAVCTRKSIGMALYQYAVEKGKRIVAVSDMYLSSDVIGMILSFAGYHIDTIFVSCEYSAEKHKGRLFLIALKQLDIKNNQVVHFGDNWISDTVGASIAGIASMHIPTQKLLYYMRPCDEDFADRYLIPFVANRVSRMEHSALSLGYEVYGPLIVGFCQWLNVKLHEGQYQRVLFCARDMRQIMETYLRLYPEDKDIVCYCFVSIRSLIMPYRAVKGEDSTVDAQEQLENLRIYLMHLGCTGKVALVDSGLNGRTQKMLTAIVGESFKIYGLYIRVSGQFYKNVSRSEASVFLFCDKPDVRCFIGAGFFEAMIAATHGRTIRYKKGENGRIQPQFGDANTRSVALTGFQMGAELFAEEYSHSLFCDCTIGAKAVQESFLRLTFFPKRSDVVVLSGITGGNEAYSTLVFHRGKIHYWFHFVDFLSDLRNTFWKGGFLATVFPYCYQLISGVYLWVDCMYLNHFGVWDDKLDPD